MTSTEAPAEDFLRRWVYDNPALADRRELFARWFTDPTPREEIAERLGLSLGELLRRFNATAPLQPALPFRYRGIPFAAVGMDGVCDDVADGRFPLFGAPVTVRCYLTDPDLLPQRMYEAADWNFMDAGRPGFVGYAYGVVHEGTVWLAGVQSDLGARYTYLFQGRGEDTEVRRGDEVVELAAEQRQEPVELVRVLRRSFQRTWIEVMLGAVLTWAGTREGIGAVGLLQFPLTADEDAGGTVVHRVYRALPGKLGATPARVRAAGQEHEYAVAPVAAVLDHLGTAFTPGG
jgi:hypothetical protein